MRHVSGNRPHPSYLAPRSALGEASFDVAASPGADAGGAAGVGDVDDAFFEDFSFSPGLRYFAELPRGFAVDTAIDPPTRQKLHRFYDPHVKSLNELIGNGEIRWWDEDGRDLAALQEETLLGGIREYETEQDERASSTVAGGAVDEANFAEE